MQTSGAVQSDIRSRPIRQQELSNQTTAAPCDAAVMSWVMQRFSDISPVTLQVVGGAMRSSLYCGDVDGLSLVESFMVELYRCKVCQFTCGLKTSISSHLLLRHDPPTLTCCPEGGLEAGLQQQGSPYQLDLNGESKQSEEDEDFLLYNMLDNMSPPTCDISTEGSLQVAHTCEVSTFFEEEEEEEEEESSILALKGDPVDLTCPIKSPSTQEEIEQSAHLMTLGLCRISAVKPPPPPPPPPAEPSAPQQTRTDGQTEAPPPDHRRLLCFLCPLTLPSRRLLDVHIQSHQAGSGFICIRCSWTSDSWEELELHWRSHNRRRRKRRRRRREGQQQQQQEEEEEKKNCHRTNRKSVSGGACSKPSDRWRGQLIELSESKEAELSNRSIPCKTRTHQSGSSQNLSGTSRTSSGHQTDPCCSLCHRKFSSKLTLRRHLGVHGGEKPYTCPHCSYSSRLKASLLQHLRTHTGEKPYRCPKCPYASIDRSSLLRHCRTHSQEKPYRCHLCPYSSIQKKSLDLHTRRHHTGEAFQCQHCEYSSPDRQMLVKHIRKHHAPL
ncbi:zinc finger protein 260 isoform X2 [Kryptolebias marmoratus]|uniref:Si:dkey-154p10.3 n=1 Tax=Kryptolebias marmoratus TaxID=37003 RepID=A0A3Q3B8P7_KRYMA|nr:zinc finger protein 260 isoform X2 [Kryptolebias marmoratus]